MKTRKITDAWGFMPTCISDLCKVCKNSATQACNECEITHFEPKPWR